MRNVGHGNLGANDQIGCSHGVCHKNIVFSSKHDGKTLTRWQHASQKENKKEMYLRSAFHKKTCIFETESCMASKGRLGYIPGPENIRRIPNQIITIHYSLKKSSSSCSPSVQTKQTFGFPHDVTSSSSSSSPTTSLARAQFPRFPTAFPGFRLPFPTNSSATVLRSCVFSFSQWDSCWLIQLKDFWEIFPK